jgi:hypothetical protein
VGNISEWRSNPYVKAYRIRNKFLSNNFMQAVTEDFMSAQNLERKIDEAIITDHSLFMHYEIYDKNE